MVSEVLLVAAVPVVISVVLSAAVVLWFVVEVCESDEPLTVALLPVASASVETGSDPQAANQSDATTTRILVPIN